MVKKSQLRKYTVEKIMQLVSSETNGQSLKLFSECINDKNKLMIQKRQNLHSELQQIRKQFEKIFREMNDGVKDRMEMKEKIILDKNSRPSNEDIKQVSSLFTYLQNQHNLMKRNTHDLKKSHEALLSNIQSLKPKAKFRIDSSDLDQQYYQLNQQCQKEQKVRDQLLKQRDANRKHYNSIASCIEECRVEYELVEERIRQKQRQLIQLTSYFQTRQQQDQSILEQLRNRNMNLESELLKAQQILNNNSIKCQALMIRQIQASKTISFS